MTAGPLKRTVALTFLGSNTMTAEERLEKLEREIIGMRRRYRWLLATCLGLTVALFVLPGFVAQDAKIVRAERFEVLDAKGNIRAMFFAEKDTVMLNLRDENGQTGVGMIVNKDGPGISLLSKDGKIRIALTVDKDQSAMLLNDNESRVRAALLMGKDGPEFGMTDEKGKVVWHAP